jgi:D-tyrosyl-tRNA(Tyr) deacylase
MDGYVYEVIGYGGIHYVSKFEHIALMGAIYLGFIALGAIVVIDLKRRLQR